ncbi:MAG TPA: FHA domain-containing protein [Acidimicrobiia bacterium]|nr:FHA domain-containing protein [Acidimicrobiia bacterium]
MPALLLTLLKFIFVAFVYLFVWQVARAVGLHVGAGETGRRSKPSNQVVVVKSETQAGMDIAVRDAVVLGRSAQADIVLEDPYASEFHLRLVRQDEGIVLHDLGSTNGTYVNGRRVGSPIPLNKGDAIQVGKTIMEVR